MGYCTRESLAADDERDPQSQKKAIQTPKPVLVNVLVRGDPLQTVVAGVVDWAWSQDFENLEEELQSG